METDSDGVFFPDGSASPDCQRVGDRGRARRVTAPGYVGLFVKRGFGVVPDDDLIFGDRRIRALRPVVGRRVIPKDQGIIDVVGYGTVRAKDQGVVSRRIDVTADNERPGPFIGKGLFRRTVNGTDGVVIPDGIRAGPVNRIRIPEGPGMISEDRSARPDG